jgi:hypothetical protein
VRPFWADLLKTGSRCWIAFTSLDIHYPYCARMALDAETGERLAEWVDKQQAGLVQYVIREYDPATGKAVRERRFDWGLEAGGLKAGAKTEKWNRRTDRTFDPATGKAIGEEVYHYDDQGRTGGPWVKVQP